MTKGFVESIYTSPGAGQAMIEQDTAMLIKGKGIAGDRYAEGKGAYSNSKRQLIRHVSLIGREALDEANDFLMEPYKPSETRRNILTGGIIDLGELVDVEFRIGDVALRGVEICDPCRRPEKLSGKPGFNDAFATREGHPAYGGLRAEVLESGIIAIGNRIEIQ